MTFIHGSVYGIDKPAPSSDRGKRPGTSPGLPSKCTETNDLHAGARQTGNGL
jgi:hypothetical protein